MEVKLFMQATQNFAGFFQLVQAMPYAIEIGDVFSVSPGCDQSLAMCQDRFHNVVNFRGEPFIPGLDKLFRTA